MKYRWKILFWVSLGLLVLSNIFWIYVILDNAVGMTYFKDTCTKHEGDMLVLKGILETKLTKENTISFLNQHKVKFESFPKGDEFVIQLNSFDIIFNKEGHLINSDTHY